MKIYFPLNLNFPPLETKFYGWIDKETDDIFICSFYQPKWFPEFNEVEIEKCIELGILSSDSTMSKSVQLPNSNNFLNLNNGITKFNTNDHLVLIYYKIRKELSKSADFSNQFSSFPLKQVKWASILNCNEDGQFLKLTRTQKFLSDSVTSFLSLNFIKKFLIFAQQNSLRPFSIYSNCLDQFFKKKDHFTELYRYLLLNESVLSDQGRNQYRNNLILTASDLIFGSILLPHLLFFSFPWIKDSFFKNFTINFFEDYLDWFMGWPAGFKFNANLTKFFGKFFLSLLAVWKVLVFPFLEIDGTSADLLCNFKHFGLTFIFGFVSDFFSISTLHIILFYRLMTRIYRFYLCLMISLFRLFRGKKWNVLRKRVDATEYTMDQLLVGMLFFSMLFCTFPTVTAYYLLFTASIIFVSSVKCFLESLTIILNSFPIYFLFLKSFNNPIITQRFRLIPYDLKTRTPSFILTLEPPKHSEIFSDLFAQLIDCWSQVYNQENIYKIITGYPI